MKKLILASLLASATFAAQATTIAFDPTGNAGGTGGAINITTFDWSPGNALAIGALSNPNPNASTQTVAQAQLGVFKNADTNQSYLPPTGQFTFQTSFYEFSSGIGGTTTQFTLDPSKPSVFSMYYNPTAVASEISGAGYSAGTLIYSGTLTSVLGQFVDFSRLNPTGFPPVLLDGLNSDNQNGVRTHVGNGNNTLVAQTTFIDKNFFLTNIDVMTVIMSLFDASALNTPFLQTNPSDQVVGKTPFYSTTASGQRINGLICNGVEAVGGTSELGAAGQTCDFHFQADASSSFNIPEPATLGLLGFGLLGAGVFRRRRS